VGLQVINAGRKMQALPEVFFPGVAVALAEVLGSFFDKKKRTGSVERKQM